MWQQVCTSDVHAYYSTQSVLRCSHLLTHEATDTTQVTLCERRPLTCVFVHLDANDRPQSEVKIISAEPL